MKIIYNDWLKNGLDEFLLSQEGINNVKIAEENLMNCVIIDGNLSPSVIATFIDLYQENKCSTMFSFDKGVNVNLKEITYHADDMCCEYCHMYFIRKLFDNDKIISVKSNFSLEDPAVNIEYIVCYQDTASEKEILEFIEKNL